MLAMCLMMLTKDDGGRNPEKKVAVENGEPDSVARKKQSHQCEICKKWFRSSQLLGGQKIIHRKKAAESKQRSFQSDCSHNHDHKHNGHFMEESIRIFDFPFCGKVFGSGQALGGHKRSHLMAGGSSRSSSSGASGVEKITSGKLAEDKDVYNIQLIFPVNYY